MSLSGQLWGYIYIYIYIYIFFCGGNCLGSVAYALLYAGREFYAEASTTMEIVYNIHDTTSNSANLQRRCWTFLRKRSTIARQIGSLSIVCVQLGPRKLSAIRNREVTAKQGFVLF